MRQKVALPLSKSTDAVLNQAGLGEKSGRIEIFSRRWVAITRIVNVYLATLPKEWTTSTKRIEASSLRL